MFNVSYFVGIYQFYFNFYYCSESTELEYLELRRLWMTVPAALSQIRFISSFSTF